jgi:hypothetical protein
MNERRSRVPSPVYGGGGTGRKAGGRGVRQTPAFTQPPQVSAWGTPLPPRFRVVPPPPQAGEGVPTAGVGGLL